ncbi:hypothetical protein ACF0H5_022237 [Mactra antiquata]
MMESEDNQMICETNQSENSSDFADQSGLMLFKTKENNSDTSDEDSETYYFESDHIALKHNHDYQLMLRTIAMLESQRIQAVKDLDKLYEQQQEALKDPIQFVDKLQRGIDLGLPKPQKIVDIPDIRWEQYTSNIDFTTFGTHRHMTRLKRQLVDGNTTTQEEVKVPSIKNESGEVIRGRIKTEKKSDTFNQLWTAEEQRRLEELLVTYPPEEVEARRFQKIATALGNRTPTQVQSRVQKYFIKLAKAGLPIPGRAPNMGIYKKKSQRNNALRNARFTMPSTFLTSVAPPVYMSDDDDNSQSYDDQLTFNNELWDGDVSDDESVPVELRSTPEYLELLRLKKLKKEKYGGNSTSNEHIGFKCDRCNIEPIVGTRWHCTDCPPDIAVDFCEDCVDSGYETETHNSSHRLKPKYKSENTSYMDTDYMSFIPGGNCSGYNYLDPNYMPAS